MLLLFFLFNFIERLVQILLEISDIEANGASAVENCNAYHHHVQALTRWRLVGMVMEIMIDASFQRKEIVQANHPGETLYRPRIFRGRRKANSPGVYQRELRAIIKEQNVVYIAGLRMCFLLESGEISPL